MSSNEALLFCLGQNDPRVNYAFVNTANSSRLGEALRGNTHVESLEVKLGDCPSDVVTSTQQEDAVTARWKALCRVIRELKSLKCVTISFSRGSSEEDYVLMGLLLQHAPQIKELRMDCSELTLSGLFFSLLDRGIRGHDELEAFHLDDFRVVVPTDEDESSSSASTIDVFAETLSSLPKLKRLSLAPCFDIRDVDDFDLNPMVDASNLLRLLSLPLLEELNLVYFEFGRQHSDALRKGLSARESRLRRLSVEECDMTTACLGALIQGLESHLFLKDLELDALRISDYYRDDDKTAHLLEPLSRNTSLNRLVISFRGLREHDPWPLFDFMRENTSIQNLIIPDSRQTRGSYSSLFRALGTNATLETLDLGYCNSRNKKDVVDALAAMIRDNTSLKRICIRGHSFSGTQLLELVPSLVQNTTLEYLDVTPFSSNKATTSYCRGNKIESADTAEFVRGVLLGSRGLKTLKVGYCRAKDVKTLVPIMAHNHRLENLSFRRRSSSSSAAKTEAAAAAHSEMLQVIGTLNAHGRRYLVERGPECRAAGVKLLSAVSDNLDCLFYHLRENPELCDCGGGVARQRKARALWCCCVVW